MPLIKITDHAARAVARLVSQFKDSVEVAGMARVLGAQVQEVEDALYSILVFRSVSGATGFTLDRIGALIGAPDRGSLIDSDYRKRINAQILSNKSEGTALDLYNIVVAMHPVVYPTDRWEIRMSYPLPVANAGPWVEATAGWYEGNIINHNGRLWRAVMGDGTQSTAGSGAGPEAAGVVDGWFYDGDMIWALMPVSTGQFDCSVEIRMQSDGAGAIDTGEVFGTEAEAREVVRYLKDAAAGGVRVLLFYRLETIGYGNMFRVYGLDAPETTTGLNNAMLYAVVDRP